jgi:hypothetical protein
MCRQAVAVAPDKPFLIGEFGAAQNRGPRFGYKNWDGCRYYETPQEPLVALQVAEAVLAAVNAGIEALAYWTFSDFPDEHRGKGNRDYTNKWGTSRWSGTDHSTRDLHYGLAQLTRNFRGPAAVLHTVSSSENVRAACVRQASGAVAIAVLSREGGSTPITVEFGEALDKPFRKYLFDPAKPPQHPFGDLPEPDAVMALTDGSLTDEIPPTSLVVYTTDYDDSPPAKVEDVRVEQEAGGARTVRWSPVADGDLCYYRIFNGKEQLGSTVVCEFRLPAVAQESDVHIVAVDTSGNASR